MENYDDIRLWSLRFQLLRPMETLPVPYEVVLEKQISPAYHLEGRGRPADHTQIVCTISGEGAFRLHIHALEARELPRFLPGGPSLHTITAAVKRYLTTPLAWDLVLHTAPQAAQPGLLGSCRLGSTAFLCETSSQERCYHFSQAAVL